MTGDAIAVDATTQGFGIWRALKIGGGLMLVVMMTEVLRGRPGLVLAIAGHRRPGKLEGQENEKKDREPATHGPDCISENHLRKSTAGCEHRYPPPVDSRTCRRTLHPQGRIAEVHQTALLEIGAIQPSRGVTTHRLGATYTP